MDEGGRREVQEEVRQYTYLLMSSIRNQYKYWYANILLLKKSSWWGKWLREVSAWVKMLKGTDFQRKINV